MSNLYARKYVGARKLRAELKLLPLNKKQRECLRCEKSFKSEGNHNRLCPHCQSYPEGGDDAYSVSNPDKGII